MADKKPAPAESEGGGHWLGITIEVIVVIAILAAVVWNFRTPFSPTFLNIDYIFGKMLVAFRAVVEFVINGNVGGTVKFFVGLLVVFLAGLNFYLFLRILEMEEEHKEHAYHHAEEHERPRALGRQILFDIGELAHDTTGAIATGVSKVLPADLMTDGLNRVLYRDDADIMDAPSTIPDATYRHELDEKEGSSKWRMVLKHAGSRNPSDWKLAIIEADTILDALVERSGFPGNTLGERLKNADRGVFRSLDYAWEAHKVRNRIAHEGTDFNLSERDAKKTIQQYEEVFKEFSYI